MHHRYVSPRAKVPPSVFLGEGVRIYGPTSIGEGCIIEDYAVIGKPDMYALDGLRRKIGHLTFESYEQAADRATKIGEAAIIGTGTQIYCGTSIGDGVETEDYVRIGWDARIGDKTRLMFRAQVYVGVTIGEGCRIAGFIGDYTVIEERVSFFGASIHDYPLRTTTYEYKPSPRICADAIVAFGAQVVGGVRIGERAYVGANAVVTRDVPDDAVVVEVNRQCTRAEWPGKLGWWQAEDRNRESPGHV